MGTGEAGVERVGDRAGAEHHRDHLVAQVPATRRLTTVIDGHAAGGREPVASGPDTAGHSTPQLLRHEGSPRRELCYHHTSVHAGRAFMSVNKVILVGNLGRDVELRHTPGGATVAKFSVATNEKWKDKAGQLQEHTEWHNIVAWGKLAEFCGTYLSEGAPGLRRGHAAHPDLRRREGQPRYFTEVRADTIQLLGPKPGGAGGAARRRPGRRAGRRAGLPAGPRRRDPVLGSASGAGRRCTRSAPLLATLRSRRSNTRLSTGGLGEHMSGPVWRFEKDQSGTCDVCLRPATGVFREGDVSDNTLSSQRLVCPDCMRRWNPLVVGGELGRKSHAPAYAR